MTICSNFCREGGGRSLEVEQTTRSYNDISYQSIYEEGYLDVIAPIEFGGNHAVFFAVIKRILLSKRFKLLVKGYIVVNMNYELALSAAYPTPLLQENAANTYTAHNAEIIQLVWIGIYFAGESIDVLLVR